MYSALSLHRRCICCRWGVFVLALAFFAPAGFASPGALSFDDALRVAVDQAPLLQARRAQIDAAEQDAVRASALPDPKLTLGLANWPVSGADAFDLRADDMTTKQIGLMQEFPARAKRQARQALASRNVEQAQALSAAERLSVRQSTAMAWIALWAAKEELASLQALREPSAVATRTAKARFANGVGSASETLATRAAELELDNRLLEAEANVEAARASLARWLGDAAPSALNIVGALPDLATLPAGEATLLASLDRQGPLLPWHSRQATAEAQVDAAIAGKRPDWSLGLTYGQRERAPDGMPRSDMLMLEFAIDLPLFPRNRQDRDIAARRAELDAVAAEYEDARRSQRAAVRSDLAEWNALKRLVVRIETESLPLARDRARTAMGLYAGGGDLQPWLEARRDEIELRIEYARQQGELGRAWSALAYLLPDEEPLP